MPHYNKLFGRLRLVVNEGAYRQPLDVDGAEIQCPDGHNDSCPITSIRLSLEELRDLQFLIERALAQVEEPQT